MATFGNREILIKIDELPKVNGMNIESIYQEYFDNRGVKDYRVHPKHAEKYYSLRPYFHGVNSKKYPILHTRTLPPQLQAIFDEPQEAKYQDTKTGEIYHKKIMVSSIWYRTSDSGHGGFIDDSITLNGAGLIRQSDSDISITRNDKNTTRKELTGITEKLLGSIINISGTVELLKEYEYRYYECTTLRRVDNWWYPSPVCSGWRRSHKMPYVTLDNKKSLRVLNDDLKCHVFFLKVEPDEVQIGEEYCIIDFSYGYDEEPDKYCSIRRWAHFKQSDPNGMIHFRIDKLCFDKSHNEKYAECTVVGQEIKKSSKKEYSLDSFYRIVRIVNTDDLENEYNRD